MTWKELLVALREDTLNDRSDRIEGDDDKLWSDTTLTRSLNEAQRRFARRSLCLRDGSSPVTLVQTVAGQREYQLDPSIIAVISARWVGSNDPTVLTGPMAADGHDLARGGHSAFAGFMPAETAFIRLDSFRETQPGKPVAVSTDEETAADNTGSYGRVVMRVFPVCSPQYAGGNIRLRVIRGATAAMDMADLEQSPEIPEDYHLALVDYAAYLCLRIVDHDLGDPERAAEYEARFNRQVEEAKRETMRKLYAPQPWGFGRGGFGGYVPN